MDIEVNGTHYASWDDVPAELRAIVDQALPGGSGGTGAAGGLGGLDGLERLVGLAGSPGGSPGIHVTRSTTSVEVGGKTYDSIDQAPPEIRDALRRAGLGGPMGSTAAQPTDTPFAAGTPAFGTPPPPAPPASPGPGPVPGPDQVVLNGIPVSVTAATGRPAKRRWWRRSS